MSLLATYGTLLRVFGRHTQLGVADRLTFVTRCRWSGRLYDLGPYPGAVPGDETIHGELFRLRDSTAWSLLDRYEGFDPDHEEASLFVRRSVSLTVPADRIAQVYWYNGPLSGHKQVSSGDWAAYVGAGNGS
jgi:gamma-glutamylcyclotransferase (GGCT)/AIG2-like uncharacterized protein YtfP